MGRIIRHFRSELEQNGIKESLKNTFRKGVDELLGIKELKEEFATSQYFLNLTQSTSNIPMATGGQENYSYVMYNL